MPYQGCMMLHNVKDMHLIHVRQPDLLLSLQMHLLSHRLGMWRSV
jgi:hypothetical protein